MNSVVVVIPVHNRRSLLVECLQRVLEQTLVPDQIIVVDDYSTDSTMDFAQIQLSGHPNYFRIKWTRNRKERGIGQSRMQGAEDGGPSRYIAFLDSDDLWATDFLDRSVAHMDSNSEWVATTSDRLREDFSTGEIFYRDFSILNPSARNWLFTKDAAISSCTLIRRKDFDSVGGFDLSLPAGEDLQLFLSLAESRQWGHVPGKPTHYRVNIGKTRGESDSISETQLSRWLIWCGIWEKHAQSFSGVVMPAKECAELMASRWHRAARECVSENNLKALAHCYRRISYWNSMERGI